MACFFVEYCTAKSRLFFISGQFTPPVSATLYLPMRLSSEPTLSGKPKGPHNIERAFRDLKAAVFLQNDQLMTRKGQMLEAIGCNPEGVFDTDRTKTGKDRLGFEGKSHILF